VDDNNSMTVNPEDFQAIRAILLKYWDPLKVAGQTTSSDKYDVYAHELVLAAKKNAKFDHIMIYVFLRHIELERFPGLKIEEVRIESREKAAKAVLDYFQSKKIVK